MTGDLDQTDRNHLRRAVDLAREALSRGDEPFGSLLVSAAGEVLFEDHNHVVATGDATRHPELAIARWAATNLDPPDRAVATVYTSNEHCPMCAAAHAWVGLGRVVLAASASQLTGWLTEAGIPPAAVSPLPISAVAPGVVTVGPDPELAEEVRRLQLAFHGRPT